MTIRIPKVNKDSTNYLDFGFEKINPSKAAEALQWGLSTEEVKAWTQIHEMSNSKAQKEWIEDLFEEMNFHRECQFLREGKELDLVLLICKHQDEYYSYID